VSDIAAYSRVRPPLRSLNPSILVVDDDAKIRELVTDLLSMEGYSVYTATNGADGLQLLERTTPRLVVLDIRMPVLDGWGFARALKARTSVLPMLVMSGAVDARRCASELGADAFMSKPFDLDDFLNVVERLFLAGMPRGAPTGLHPRSAKPVHPASPVWCTDLSFRRLH